MIFRTPKAAAEAARKLRLAFPRRKWIIHHYEAFRGRPAWQPRPLDTIAKA